MKKLLLFLLVLLFLLSCKTNSYALTSQQSGQAQDAYQKSGDVSNPVHVFDVKDADSWWIVCNVIGGESCSADVKLHSYYRQNSVIGKISSTMAMMYQQPPAQTYQFIAYYGQKMGVVKPAYAQGIGFSGLSPLMGLWQGFRNIAYGFLILVMVVIGFMILFRAKIDPRTVISVQNAIPRIIVTLFLITFSYAIVGLLIDVMYILMYLVFFALSNMVPFEKGKLAEIFTQYSGGNFINLVGVSFNGSTAGIQGITSFFGGNGWAWATTVGLGIVGAILGGGNPVTSVLLLGLFGGLGAAAAGNNMNPLVALLVVLAILFTSIRIFIMLLNSYISILISLIFGPLQIMLGAIPNSNAFSSWIRNLIANVVVFPITAVLLLLGTVVSSMAYGQGKPLWTPPGLSGSSADMISGIISLGFVFIIPSIAGAIKEALKAKPLMPSGTSSLFQPITSVYGTAMGGVSQVYYLSQLRGLFGKGKH